LLAFDRALIESYLERQTIGTQNICYLFEVEVVFFDKVNEIHLVENDIFQSHTFAIVKYHFPSIVCHFLANLITLLLDIALVALTALRWSIELIASTN